jgi:hypothetical protein
VPSEVYARPAEGFSEKADFCAREPARLSDERAREGLVELHDERNLDFEIAACGAAMHRHVD